MLYIVLYMHGEEGWTPPHIYVCTSLLIVKFSLQALWLFLLRFLPSILCNDALRLHKFYISLNLSSIFDFHTTAQFADSATKKKTFFYTRVGDYVLFTTYALYVRNS